MRRHGRALRAGLAVVAVAASVLLLGATPSPVPDDEADGGDESELVEVVIDPVRDAEYWLEDARVYEAWETTRGKGVTIAIIDTGIGKVPEAFGTGVVGGTDVSGIGTPDGRTPVGIVDWEHGTLVASVAAARGRPDGTGMIGVAPEADLLSISVGFGASAQVSFTEQIANAVVWAVDNGADVINMSLTTNTLDWDPSWDDAFLYAFENDVVIVVAAGNRDSGTRVVGAPATIPGVLTVAGVDRAGRASQSASTQGITIGISAPSEELLGIAPDGTLWGWKGTSGAAPIVAGVAALVRSAHPDLDAANVINRIIKSAAPAAGVVRTPDPLYGYGLVDAAAAVSDSIAPVSANPMGDLAEWVRLYRRAEAAPPPDVDVPVVEIPPLPAAEPPTESTSPLLPSAETLMYGTLPLVAVSVPGILIALGITAATRRIRQARPRVPSLTDN